MQSEIPILQKPRVAFLFVLAIGISFLFFRVIEDFVMALVIAAVLAGLTDSTYRQLLPRLRGRANVAAAITVVLTLLIIIVPILLLLVVLADDAVQLSERVGSWISEQTDIQDRLERKIDATPALRRLLPYQDQIIQKAGQLAVKTASFVSQQFSEIAGGTAKFFMLLFMALYAMFYFLKGGRALIVRVLSYTPLTAGDKHRLLDTFTSVARATLKSTLVIGIVQGGLSVASFAVVGIKEIVFWGALMMALSLVPAIGAGLVWIPTVIYLAMTDRIGAAIGVGLWCAIVGGTVDNILRPLLVGKDTKMPDLLILLTTLGGFFLFGAVGIVLGPIIGALFTTVWTLWGAAVDEGNAEQAVKKEEECC